MQEFMLFLDNSLTHVILLTCMIDGVMPTIQCWESWRTLSDFWDEKKLPKV